MIGRLKGILAEKRAPQVLIDCNGVGYEVNVSMTTYYQLPEPGEPISIWTHLLVKDDSHSLVGFTAEHERKLFRQLIRVNGVGPKMALTILSGITGHEFALCVTQNDIVTLTRLPGVGKKTAERLIIEMRDKVEDLMDATHVAIDSGDSVATTTGRSSKNEALEALQSLGYKPGDADRMIRQAERDAGTDMSAATLIRKALQASISR
jgi:Holliday junction DNA helicase RuvA